jgi:hypothetical protein
MTQKFNLFVGKAGQLYAMSEFLMRGWNVAMPEVDSGDDIFVVEVDSETFYRVQVKTAQAVDRKDGYSVQFSVPLRQLQEADESIYFVFAVRRNNDWSELILLSQYRLYEFRENYNIGSVVGNNLTLYFAIKENRITCSKIDLTDYRNNFSDFPIIEH